MGTAPLDEPFRRFIAQLDAARRVGPERLPEPTAFALATASPDGRPSVRMLLLKGVDERGFVFYTNLESRKGSELLATKRAAMCFHWQPLELQVRVEGSAHQVTQAEADEYFASRVRESQVGAWASQQSRRLERADELEERVRQVEGEFAGRAVSRPPYWSGFRLVPERIEFWQSKPGRLHVRELYVRDGDGWKVDRLYP